MLTLIVRWSLSRPRLVALLAVLIVAYGLVTLSRAKFDVFPDFVPPQVEVQTEAPGLSAEQVEQLITRPIEQAIAGGQGIEAVRSESIQGISVVTVIFADKVDPYRARQTVTDSLVEAGPALPAIAKSPQVAPLTSSTMDLLKIGFTSDALSPEQLRSLIDTVVRPRLLSTPGVARASVYGGEVSRIEVRMRPGDMAWFNITPSDLASAVAAATGVRGGGFVDTPSQRILITPQGQAQGPDDLARGVIRSVVGQRVTVGDVADVVEAFEPRLGEALIMGRPGVLVSLSSQYGANTLDATRAVDAALAELQPALTAQRVSVNADLHRPANFINTALSGLREDLIIG
ncbi:MAG: efflux RND transporter permease subunit, partial [Caulobacteraceae bacterium]|nr:efflux RND transporter permease subunit [Caulobacteraceae bacterium]